MSSLRPHLLPVIIAVAFLATGCGGPDVDETVTGTETADIDNCALVTDAEASSLVGRDVQHDEDSPLGCGFSRPGQLMSVFTVRGFRGKGAARDNFGKFGADVAVHELPGVGDSAAALARDEKVNFLIVQRGPKYVQFVTTFVDDIDLGSAKLKEAQDLALKALDRMP